MSEKKTPAFSDAPAISFGIWFAVLAVSLLALARATEIHLVALSISVVAVVAVAVSIRLTIARRAAPTKATAIISGVVLVCGVVLCVASIKGPVWDIVGFAGLGLAMFALITLVDLAREIVARGQKWQKAPTRATQLFLIAVAICVATSGWISAIAGGAGLVIGATAIELWSARYPEWLSEHPMAPRLAGLAILFASAIVLLTNVNNTSAVWLIAIVGILVLLLIVNNGAPAILAILVIAIFWSSLPRSTPNQPGRSVVAGKPYFAVLGDSYISGEGARSFLPLSNTTSGGNECRQALTSWPLLLTPPTAYGAGQQMGIPERELFAACSGAVTADIRRNPVDDRSEPEQLELLSQTIANAGRPQFVLVSIGGNDMQFGDVGEACILPGDCGSFVKSVSESRLEEFFFELQRTYWEIRTTVGAETPVIAIPYPIPAYEGDQCEGVLLSGGDLRAVNEFADSIDSTIKKAAAATGVYYMDSMRTSLESSGEQLCEPNGPSGLNFASLNPKAGSLWSALDPQNWTHNFVHPNESGHRAMAASALQWFSTHECVVSGSCATGPLPLYAARLAAEPSGLPTPLEVDRSGPIGEVSPEVLLTTAVLALGWWLLLTGLLNWRAVDGQVGCSALGRRLAEINAGTRRLRRDPQVPVSQPSVGPLREAAVGRVLTVADLDRARAFYEGQLGLTGEQAPGGWLLRAEHGTIAYLIEGVPDAGSVSRPVASFGVDDVHTTVRALRATGVPFLGPEDLPFTLDEDGVSTDENGIAVAWMRDPDGSIVTVFELPVN